jgi:hypothetical protein
MGCIGMSMEDFCRCTPFEFRTIYEQWREKKEREERTAWERNRWMAMCMLQPYTKKQLQPEDIVIFPWEKSTSGKGRGTEKKEDIQERYRAAKAARGLR